MKRRIDSKEFYKNHNNNYYCSAITIDGKVVSLYSEYGREGGEIWAPSNSCNGDLQRCLIRLGEDFGMKFYDAVHKAAYMDKLLSTNQARLKIKQRDIKFAKEKVIKAKKAYTKAVNELNRLKNN